VSVLSTRFKGYVPYFSYILSFFVTPSGLHYNAPHWPFEGPDDEAISNSLIGRDSTQNWLNSGSPESYAALVRRLDEGVGRVLKALEDAGLANNTLVIFASDNGGERLSYFGPLSGKKGDLLEGGIRVPTIVRWPGVTLANQVSEQPIITMDLTATILAATQTKPDPRYPLDGENLIPVLQGEKPVYPRTLFWRFGGDPSFGSTNIQKAVRSGDWKYLLRGGDEHLYNLANDQGEQNDLKQKYPKIFQQLRTKLQHWESQVLPYPTA
jgi:arylsulfatase A-like enzyme